MPNLSIIRFFRRQIDEISDDKALAAFGAALAGISVLTAAFWLAIEPVDQILAPGEPPVCWPFFRQCADWRLVPPAGILGIIGTLLLGGLLNVALFIEGRVKAGYVLLLLLAALKYAVVLQDYRLIHNQHYMALWITAAFALAPHKRIVTQTLVAAFYFWAGVLKLNWDWVAGIGLYGRRPLGLPEALIPAACVYVIILELLIVFGLLSRRRWLFWFAFAQFVLFQISSFWVVGWFYPLLMFLILSVFPLCRWAPAAPSMDAGAGARARWAAACVVGAFSLCQLVPATYGGDSTITGEGRYLALHMFDAPLECRAFRIVTSAGATPEKLPLVPRYVYPRIACDPLVHFELARSFCPESQQAGLASDFTLVLETRRKQQGDFARIVEIPDFCASGTHYAVFGHNEWIRSDAVPH